MIEGPIALRAFTELDGDGTQRKGRPSQRPEQVLVIDTETTIDASQKLLFGSWRYLRIRWDDAVPVATCCEEGIFYADELPLEHPQRFEVLKDCVRRGAADVAPGFSKRLKLMPRTEFVEGVFFPAAYRARAVVVGFNLPFDLSRLAAGCTEARGRFQGGFSLGFFEYEDGLGQVREDRFRPRIAIKHIDSKRALKGFTARHSPDPDDLIPEGSENGEPEPGYVFRGHFLDLRTLVFALTDRGHTLQSACEAFGVGDGKTDAEEHGQVTPEYVAYNRQDVRATGQLLLRVLEEYYRHPIDLQPTKVYSPASIGKAYLRGMGVSPVLERQPDFPRAMLGAAMNAYFGGRAETRIRRVGMPVVLVDFLSMYPTVNALMGNWELLTAERCEILDATEDVRQLLREVSVKDCLSPEMWPWFRVLVRLTPGGDVLPVRAKYDPKNLGLQIGVNPLTFNRPLWYALPDVLAAKFLSGKVPEIVEAVRLVPVGKQEGLAPVNLRGALLLDPGQRDFFKGVIEERKGLDQGDLPESERKRLSQFLKVLANASSYGIFAEFVRNELPKTKKEPMTVWAADGETFQATVNAPETPGEYAFPPLAALVTSAARLMLALLETMVSELEGSHVFCDTDSMAIVATPDGGLVPCPGGPQTSDGEEAVKALSWGEVNGIVESLSALNPYGSMAVPGSILKIEEENFDPETGERRQLYCYSISAKRYALYNLDENGVPIIRKASQHGLGHLLNPIDPDSADRRWIEEVWRYIIRKDALALEAPEPEWFARPAISRVTVSSPHLMKLFLDYNEERPYQDQIKPFNFLLTAQVDELGYPTGYGDKPFHLVAPYSADSGDWLRLSWIDRYSGQSFRVSTSAHAGSDGVARIKTIGDVVLAYRFRPEHKSQMADGEPCGKQTRGLLARRPVTGTGIAYIGKESNRLEEVERGQVHDLAEVQSEYLDPREDPFVRDVLPVLRTIPVRVLMEETGLDRRTLQRIRAGKARPRRMNRQALTRVAQGVAGYSGPRQG